MTENPAKLKCLTFGTANVTCLSKTGVELDRISYLWTVENYSVLKNDYKEFKSPVFRGGPNYNHSWQLLMYPKNLVEGTDYLSLYLGLVDYGDKENGGDSTDGVIKTHLQFSILNQEGVPTVRAYDPYVFHSFKTDTLTYGRTRLVSVEDLVSTHRGLVNDDSFTILCEIWIHGELKERVGNGGASRLGPSEEERTKLRYESLVIDFGKLFKESIGSDVTVETTNASFKAHKCVLMARSPVFAAMFNAKMKEKEESRVKITDFDDKVVEGMLDYLYTGQTDCMAEQAEDLLKISEKYELPRLKNDCEFVIADKLSKENAAFTLILAHSHNAPYLKQNAVDFINKHKEDLLKSKSFVEAVKAHADIDLLTELYFSQ